MSVEVQLRAALVTGGLSRRDADELLAEYRALAGAEALEQEAEALVSACPEHSDADEVWMDCPCELADELRRTAALRRPAGGDES